MCPFASDLIIKVGPVLWDRHCLSRRIPVRGKDSQMTPSSIGRTINVPHINLELHNVKWERPEELMRRCCHSATGRTRCDLGLFDVQVIDRGTHPPRPIVRVPKVYRIHRLLVDIAVAFTRMDQGSKEEEDEEAELTNDGLHYCGACHRLLRRSSLWGIRGRGK